MEGPATPPQKRVTRGQNARPPPTPEVTRRIEENRLKAKALREQSLAREAAANSQSTKRTPSGFLATDTLTPASLKRPHSSISTSNVPQQSRDGRVIPKDDGIQAARKFKSYVDHDFSKMTDTKGGFLNADDDPFNKAMHKPKDDEKPAHMTLAEWERHQLLKSLRRRKEGPFEPGLGLSAKDQGKRCTECRSLEIDWQWDEVFKCQVCHACKEKFPEKYSLLTKTEVRTDYLLTNPELEDSDLLPHLSKPNPLKSHYHDMNLFLRFQVEAYAWTKWGSPEAMDAEAEKRKDDAARRKTKQFNKGLRELKKKTMTDKYRRDLQNGSRGGNFGDRIGDGKHVHSWGLAVETEDGMCTRTCTDCGMENEELVM
ncbi:hypothetical protein QTJ16_001173 [Diplocarpon rosae]|uniref:XPA C-terminal domain-containing protein n=1 Tax=Diplocarpon rosae TaxID=946125 RepID=A0AAD9T5I3_9HELO|nr:hypothetical protein QTJ16_001173 [Diplocarpon rosae]